jgi:uncharacterized membrane protein YeaQ/YmgE (transglycosylase-associated protein family)
MGIIGWILLGALAGWLASIVTGRNERQGCIGNIAVGILGAFIGGVVFRFLGGAGVTGFNPWSLLVSVVGAIILLIVLQAFNR